MQSGANGLSQSLLSHEEQIEAGHVKKTEKEKEKETCYERYTRETSENKDVCDTFCTRSILSCLFKSKELFAPDSCLEPQDRRPPSQDYTHCENAEYACCDNCMPACLGVTCLSLFACTSVPLAFCIDSVRSIGRACLKLVPESKQEPVRRVRFQT